MNIRCIELKTCCCELAKCGYIFLQHCKRRISHSCCSNEDNDATSQQSDDDLEDGELEDDGQEDIVENIVPVAETVSEEIKDSPIVSVPSTIPSLLDLKISPPRNGESVQNDLCVVE